MNEDIFFIKTHGTGRSKAEDIQNALDKRHYETYRPRPGGGGGG